MLMFPMTLATELCARRGRPTGFFVARVEPGGAATIGARTSVRFRPRRLDNIECVDDDVSSGRPAIPLRRDLNKYCMRPIRQPGSYE